MHYVLLVVLPYRECLFIIQDTIFIDCQWLVSDQNQMRMEQFWNPHDMIRHSTVTYSALSQSNWSDENGAILKPTWHSHTLDGDITVCSFSKQLIRWEWSSFKTHMTQSDAWQRHHGLFFLKAVDHILCSHVTAQLFMAFCGCDASDKKH